MSWAIRLGSYRGIDVYLHLTFLHQSRQHAAVQTQIDVHRYRVFVVSASCTYGGVAHRDDRNVQLRRDTQE